MMPGDFDFDDGSITRAERLQKLLTEEERGLGSRLSGMRSATDRYQRADRLRGELDRERARSRSARR